MIDSQAISTGQGHYTCIKGLFVVEILPRKNRHGGQFSPVKVSGSPRGLENLRRMIGEYEAGGLVPIEERLCRQVVTATEHTPALGIPDREGKLAEKP
jgi:hypothetical protein